MIPLPETPYFMKTTGIKLVKVILVLFLVQVTVLAFFYVKFDHNQKSFESLQNGNTETLRINAKALVDNNRKSCELGKRGSQDSADFQTAQATYIKTVTGARSVKEDVKKAARKALKVFKRTAAGSRRRAHRNCIKAFPYNTKGF